MKRAYKHIFFDLDHTLWDFETNSKSALEKIFAEENLAERGIPSFEAFHKRYLPINDRYWANFHNRFCTKEQIRVGRFSDTLACWNIKDDALANRVAERYLAISPRMTALFPDAIEVLKYLQGKYALHLITNGFAEVQWIKIEHSGLKPFFEHILISEEVGTQKPDKEIFDLAMNRANTYAEECIMIGDNYSTDMVGARKAGMDQIFFNSRRSHKKNISVTYQISSLKDLLEIL